MDRAFRRIRQGRARVRAAEEHEASMARREREMADTRVKDIEDWIRIVQTRTRAIELLRLYSDDPAVAAFLKEVSDGV